MRERLHQIERLEAVLPAISAVAASYEGVYLVGGAVRDVLLGEQSLDLDVMVEGDAIALARELARALGGRSHPHEKFQTAVVKATDEHGHEIRVDLATARTEFYGAPGALPEVERSTLRHDLARRDFTINAMATSLRPDDLGATYDFFGGYRDLQRGTVRVLHNLSFVEDPTRLLRAIRYEARLGFRMDAHTLSLARGCIDMRLVGDLSSARLRDELLDLLAEPQRARGARAHGRAGPRPRAARAPRRARRGRPRASRAERGDAGAARRGAPRRWCGLPACAPGMAGHEVYEWLGRLKIRRRDQDVVAAAVTLGPVIAERLSGDAPPAPSELHELLEGQPLEVLVMAIVLAGDPRLVAERAARLPRARRAACTSRSPATTCSAAGVPESPADRHGAEADARAEARRLRQRPRRGAARPRCGCWRHERRCRIDSRPCPTAWNALQWDGEPGHYEVYYLTFTDPASGVGFWIRYTMVAPLPETGEEATCSLWFMAMDPADPSANVGEKVSFPVVAAERARRARSSCGSATRC